MRVHDTDAAGGGGGPPDVQRWNQAMNLAANAFLRFSQVTCLLFCFLVTKLQIHSVLGWLCVALLSVCLSARLSVCLCLSLCLSVCLSVCLPVPREMRFTAAVPMSLKNMLPALSCSRKQS